VVVYALRMRLRPFLVIACLAASGIFVACGSSDENSNDNSNDTGSDASMEPTAADGGGVDATQLDVAAADGAPTDGTLGDGAPEDGVGGDDAADACALTCSVDGRSVVDCNGNVAQACSATEACDAPTHTCINACALAANAKGSVGCDFYATRMETLLPDACFAAFVVNPSASPLHISVELPAGTALPVATFARIPSGLGTGVGTITYDFYDDVGGLPAGSAAALFLSGGSGTCPTAAAVPSGTEVAGTGVGHAFHITTDVPAVVYEMNPYGGGAAGIPGASLLLPTSAWDTNYLAVTAAPYAATPTTNPSINLIAAEDATQVTIRPSVALAAGGALDAGAAGTPYTFTLNKGEQAQFSQQADLSGSIVQATKPIGLMAGHACAQTPVGTDFCEHDEQMIPPVKAIGHEYAAVMFRPRVTGDKAFWRVIALVDGTQLTYSSNVGGPAALAAAQSATFTTDQPFTVASQDAAHPFLVFASMSGSQWSQLSQQTGYGDPDFVVAVPPAQFLTSYDFFVDPTFPEANLVVVRAKDAAMNFDDVELDCAGVLGNWTAVGAYEWARIDLLSHDFVKQGGCTAGHHTITSSGPFGVTVWGWGSPETTAYTKSVSYGYPAGMSVKPLNSLVLQP